jgi:hypothetical protein
MSKEEQELSLEVEVEQLKKRIDQVDQKFTKRMRGLMNQLVAIHKLVKANKR